jgi:phosphate transport system protein
MQLRAAYHESLEAVETELGTLGALMVDALHHAVRAVQNGDTALAARIIAGADQTAEMGRRIEAGCIELIWRQQPLAAELRRVAAMFEISTDLQRINHYIADVAKHAVRLTDVTANAPRDAVADVARLTENNLQRAVSAYSGRDLFLARSVEADDEEFERLYSAGIKGLQNAIRRNAEVLPAATELLFVLTSLERIGEHASSIAWHTEEMLEGEPA